MYSYRGEAKRWVGSISEVIVNPGPVENHNDQLLNGCSADVVRENAVIPRHEMGFCLERCC